MQRLTSFLALAVLGLSACASGDAMLAQDDLNNEKRPERTTIYDVASTTEGFGILAAAVDAAGLDGVLDGNRQFTVFAPTDDAFVALLDELDVSAADLLADTDLLTSVLLYHVAPGSRLAEDVLDSNRIRTMEGSFAAISTDSAGAAYIDDAQIVATDIEVDNGVIHVIDAVILP